MKNKKTILITLAMLIVAGFVALQVWQNNRLISEFKNNDGVLKIAGKYVGVEYASTPEKRQRGLMFREKMETDHGMFFTFDKMGYYGFWMKNTLIPLDILWIDENLYVVDIKTNFAACASDPCETYTPKYPAKYVLELNSGWVINNQVKIGDQIEIVKK
jgi:uncharacterized protein